MKKRLPVRERMPACRAAAQAWQTGLPGNRGHGGVAAPAADARIYFLLAEVYRREPTAELLKELARPRLAAALRNCAMEDLGTEKSMPGLLRQLAEEYARLFIVPGPDRAAPCESVYSKVGEASLYGPEAVDVKKFIKMLRLRLKENLLPDHVSVELEVVGRLSELEGNAYSRGDARKAGECRQARGMFLEKHLARWFPRFAESVERSARLPFYRRITAFAATFIARQTRENAA